MWLPLISFGVAGAAGLALLLLAALQRTGAVTGTTDAARTWLVRRLLGGSLVALASTGIAIAVLANVDVAAAWRQHADGVWIIWLAIAGGFVVIACLLLASPTRARSYVAATLVVAAFSIVALVAILPATAHASRIGIGLFAIGGFAGALAGPGFGYRGAQQAALFEARLTPVTEPQPLAIAYESIRRSR